MVLLGLSMLLGALLANPGVLGMSPRWGGVLAQLLFLAVLGLLVRWAWSQRGSGGTGWAVGHPSG